MYSITQYGKPLDKNKYTIDEKNKVFSSSENNLVLDFSGEYGWSFNTDSYCTFDTGSGCTFDTDSYCTFDTGSGCTFKTGSSCTFCVVVRRDVCEIIELPKGKTIKLNGYGIKGYTIVEDEPKETIIIGGITYDKAEVEEKLKDIKPTK